MNVATVKICTFVSLPREQDYHELHDILRRATRWANACLPYVDEEAEEKMQRGRTAYLNFCPLAHGGGSQEVPLDRFPDMIAFVTLLWKTYESYIAQPEAGEAFKVEWRQALVELDAARLALANMGVDLARMCAEGERSVWY